MGCALVNITAFACVYAGYRNYPLWSIPIFAAVTLVLFYLLKPGALSFGLKERGISYLLSMIVTNTVMMAVPFFVGVFASWAIHQIIGQSS